MAKSVVRASEYGARPSNPNNMDALEQAFSAVRGMSDVRLEIEPGDYHLEDDAAVEFTRKIMDGEFGLNPQEHMFFPYAPYVEGVVLRNAEHVTVEATGVRFLYSGWMQPLAIEGCSDVTIIGLTVDYLRKPFSIGRIVRRGRRSFDVAVDGAFPIGPGVPTPRVEFWNATKGTLHPRALYVKRRRVIGNQRIRIFGPAPAGDDTFDAMIVHSLHFRPAVLLHDSSDIVLRDLVVHSQPGMGIVGHRCHEITLDRVAIVPTTGMHMSTNTDATHFTTCTGTIRFHDCRFEGQGDDSTNIHNYYYSVRRWSPPNRLTIAAAAPGGTHIQVLDHPDPGDVLEIVDRRTLGRVGTCRVETVRNDPESWESTITTSGDLPGSLEGCLLANTTRLPAVRIVSCSMKHHLARGILIKTRDVIIENCVFEETTGTGIHVGAESWWHEGVPSADVTIRNNQFHLCGRGSGQIGGASAVAVTIEADDPTRNDLHLRMRIENNRIEADDDTVGILVGNTSDARIVGNEVRGRNCSIRVQYSKGVVVSGNRADRVDIGHGVTDLHEV